MLCVWKCQKRVLWNFLRLLWLFIRLKPIFSHILMIFWKKWALFLREILLLSEPGSAGEVCHGERNNKRTEKKIHLVYESRRAPPVAITRVKRLRDRKSALSHHSHKNPPCVRVQKSATSRAFTALSHHSHTSHTSHTTLTHLTSLLHISQAFRTSFPHVWVPTLGIQ